MSNSVIYRQHLQEVGGHSNVSFFLAHRLVGDAVSDLDWRARMKLQRPKRPLVHSISAPCLGATPSDERPGGSGSTLQKPRRTFDRQGQLQQPPNEHRVCSDQGCICICPFVLDLDRSLSTPAIMHRGPAKEPAPLQLPCIAVEQIMPQPPSPRHRIGRTRTSPPDLDGRQTLLLLQRESPPPPPEKAPPPEGSPASAEEMCLDVLDSTAAAREQEDEEHEPVGPSGLESAAPVPQLSMQQAFPIFDSDEGELQETAPVEPHPQ